jgi:hypothetical protein
MDKANRRDVDWRELCERASKEMDPEKLMELVRQVNDALEERDRWRFQCPPQLPPPFSEGSLEIGRGSL